MSEFSFPKNLRLLKSAEFDAVFKKPLRIQNKELVMYARKSVSAPRLGLAIAKKKIPLASNRNRIKRLIREQFRLHQASFPPVDVIVMVTPLAGKTKNAEIIDSFHSLSDRLKQRLNSD